jgi:hypothetical protein
LKLQKREEDNKNHVRKQYLFHCTSTLKPIISLLLPLSPEHLLWGVSQIAKGTRSPRTPPKHFANELAIHAQRIRPPSNARNNTTLHVHIELYVVMYAHVYNP